MVNTGEGCVQCRDQGMRRLTALFWAPLRQQRRCKYSRRSIRRCFPIYLLIAHSEIPDDSSRYPGLPFLARLACNERNTHQCKETNRLSALVSSYLVPMGLGCPMVLVDYEQAASLLPASRSNPRISGSSAPIENSPPGIHTIPSGAGAGLLVVAITGG